MEGTSSVLDISLELTPYRKAGSYWPREVSQSVIGCHWRPLEVDSDQSKACLDDQRGFVGWDWMVIISLRYSKSTFGANTILDQLLLV